MYEETGNGANAGLWYWDRSVAWEELQEGLIYAGLHVVEGSEGAVSQVRETGAAADFSAHTGYFDFHTDGLYLGCVPDLVMLHCVSEGAGDSPTIFSDSRIALRQLREEARSVLERLTLGYVGKEGKVTERPLIQPHPRTGESIIHLGARSFVRQSPEFGVEDAPSLREIADALQELFVALEAAVVRTHSWAAGDTILFDNHAFVHQRRAVRRDWKRSLLRMWLSAGELSYDGTGGGV